jgi:hypothetical protein
MRVNRLLQIRKNDIRRFQKKTKKRQHMAKLSKILYLFLWMQWCNSVRDMDKSIKISKFFVFKIYLNTHLFQ